MGYYKNKMMTSCEHCDYCERPSKKLSPTGAPYIYGTQIITPARICDKCAEKYARDRK